MIPDEWASMRSMARWVLPVLVGPSTAVTPAPRPPGLRFVGDENEMGISRPIKLAFRMFRASSAVDLKFLSGLPRVRHRNFKSKTALERLHCWCPFDSEVRSGDCCM